MTTSLPTRASTLRERLTRLDKMSSNVTEAASLEGLRAELAVRAEKIRTQLDKQALLAAASITVPPPNSLLNARKRAAGMLEKFVSETKAATLKRGQGWKALLEDAETASQELAQAVTTAWRNHRQTVFAGDTPAAVRTKLARTVANDAAYDKYLTLYTQLKAAFETLPTDKAAIDRVSQMAADLERVAQAFNFAVPPDVKQFLEAVLSVSGAPLGLLTPTVQQWLKENGSLDSYSIRSTGR